MSPWTQLMPTAPRTMLATPKPTSTTDRRSRLHRILRLEHILPRASLRLQQEEAAAAAAAVMEANRRRERSPLLGVPKAVQRYCLISGWKKKSLSEQVSPSRRLVKQVSKLFKRKVLVRKDWARSDEVPPLAKVRLCRMALSKVLKRTHTHSAQNSAHAQCAQSGAVHQEATSLHPPCGNIQTAEADRCGQLSCAFSRQAHSGSDIKSRDFGAEKSQQ